MDLIQQATVIDLYKGDHISQYMPKTEYVFSNMTPRSNRLARVIRENYDGKMTWFGMQYALKNLLSRWDSTFFSLPKETAVGKFERLLGNAVGKDHINRQVKALGELWDLGYLPLEVKTLPEGVRVDMQVPTFTITNTNPDFFWLVNYMETYLSCTIWPFCNAAGVTLQYRQTSQNYADITGADDFWVDIANHCFAARGHRGMEDAMISGMGHSLSSLGTDTFWAIDALEQYYNADSDNEMVGLSVLASEHAVACQRIAYYREQGYTRYMEAECKSLEDYLTRVYPTGIFSYVADSEDYFGNLTVNLPKLKGLILSRKPDSNGLVKFVLRPDSSPKTPLEIICGDPDAEVGSPEHKGSLLLLDEVFGHTLNDKGYKVINPMVGLLYGEAIDIEMQQRIYSKMVEMGYCVSNLLLGVGSWGFLDRASRDSYSIAVKGCHSVIDGVETPMQKNPKTAAESKKSAKGLLRVEKEGDNYVLYDQQTPEQEQQGELKTVFLNGKLMYETSLAEIRQRVKDSIK
ncbi:nicotinamide phosphoribosyl transferase [Pseudoalteromonas phage H101]|uniref:Nicotinamide phosphoribosyltransferase n=1 Tax=Pseudoalteromonas phage H101 TaxID=1654919 RepID=A0A0H4IRS0_9CAUD|nr:nicotinamide phosphoribosyl transferase [Pseudoalteromonas phage H101]AKO60978.1 nicotinamide phosphoribosyltransferase [Pseudoalteromonas phage H101]